jgi:hypothetical protein
MIGTTHSRISYQVRDTKNVYTPYAGAAGMFLPINGKFPMGKLN